MRDYQCLNCGKVFRGRDNRPSYYCCKKCNFEYKNCEVECKCCGKKFCKLKCRVTENNFCNRECYDNYNSKEVECKNCGKIFRRGNSKIQENNFCDDKCFNEFHTYEAECKNCGKKLRKRKSQKRDDNFCNKKCFGEYKTKTNTTLVNCDNCGKEFRKRNTTLTKKNFCSKKCKDEEHISLSFERPCDNCGKLFHVTNERADTAKYCSKKCYDSINHQELECSICKKKFVRTRWATNNNEDGKHYCSVECYSKRSPKIPVNCSGCGKEFLIYQSRHKYHSDYYCNNECKKKFGYNGGITGEHIVNNNYQIISRSLRSSIEYMAWRKECRKRDNEKCSECGSEENLTVHHKNMTMYDFFKKHNFCKEDVKNDPDFYSVDNGITLCRCCHAKEHRKEEENGKNS